MKNGILENTDGFDLIVNGEYRSFRDDAKIAIASAFFLKQQNQLRRCKSG